MPLIALLLAPIVQAVSATESPPARNVVILLADDLGYADVGYEGGIRIPFCMRWPDRLPAGKVVDDPVISLDLLPTAIAAADGRVGEDWRCEGVNLLPRLDGSVEDLRRLWLDWDKDNIPPNYGWNKALGNEVEHVKR